MLELLFIIYQGILNRNRGWGESPIKSGFLKRFLCLVIPSMCLLIHGTAWSSILLVLPLAYLGISVGHGRYFSLGRGPYPERPDNWPSWPARLFKVKRKSWLFDAISLSTTGLAFVIPFAVLYPALPALILVVCGILKTLAYEISIRHNFDKTDDHIKESELFAGFIYGIGFTSILWIPKLL